MDKEPKDTALPRLPLDEASILKRQIDVAERNYSFWHLYRFASRLDLFIIFIATVASCASGAAMPCMTLVFGSIQGAFQDYLFLETLTRVEFERQISHYALYFVYLGIGSFFAMYISTVGFLYTGENIVIGLRQEYFESCLRQNIAYFDQTSPGEVAARITSADKIQDGISEKVSILIAAVASLISSFVIGVTMSWKLTLIMSSIFFTLLISLVVLGVAVAKFVPPLTMATINGSVVAHEAFSAVRVAIAFGGQKHLVNQYDGHLKTSKVYGFKIKASVAVLMAFFMGISPLTYSLGFWQGSLFLVRGEITIQAMITTIMVVLIGSFNVGSISPNVQAFKTAIATASGLMLIIDREPTVDGTNESAGQKLNDGADVFSGGIRLESIKHVYPSRPDIKVLDSLSVEFEVGQITAIVGPSGSGKSTIIGLLERFYEPVQGRILLDGHDITTLNLHWLRKQIRVVGQEPVLFSGSVYSNIQAGLAGSPHEDAEESVQRELIIQAAKTAHAHDFITKRLANGYDTDVGQSGHLLSGGQKQQIAIARAIVSNPKILLLDEATSALDTKSEAAVQAALDQASVGRTTITIAHRLSTIRHAHKIIVMAGGKLIGQGTHEELLEKHGAYQELVIASQGGQRLPTEQDRRQDDFKEKKEVEIDEYASSSTIPSIKQEEMTEVSAASLPDSASPKKSLEVTDETHLYSDNGAEYGWWTLVKFIFEFNKRERLIMIFASLFSVCAGIAYPVQAVFFAKQLETLSKVNSTLHDRWEIRQDSNFWSLMLLMIGIVAFLTYTIQGLTFSHTAEALTRRARRETMAQLLRQDVRFFDSSDHAPGQLTSFLMHETAQLASMSGANLGNLITSLATVIGGGALALAVGWKLALVCLSVVPVLIGCSVVRFFILKRYENRAARIYMQSAAYAAESISAIRTVASLGLEGQIARRYKAMLDEQRRRSFRSIAKSGFMFSLAQASVLLSLGLAFWYGSTLMATLEYGIFQFYVCLMSIMFGTQSAGAMLAFTPDMVKARDSAAKLKSLFSRRSTMNTEEESGDTRQMQTSLTHGGVQGGGLELQDVFFAYPSISDRLVLRGISLVISPGHHVALVGASGCGKSTIIELLERFYDPTSGSILVDGKDISTLNVSEYRSHLAIVSQEPILFQGTIRENIRIGSTAASTDVTDDEVQAACRDANIWDFITSLPNGLDTDVGSAGALLSGGQKQRIAIARALIRQPRILLLDEATAALDSESEWAVQEALVRVSKGRTTITVAHRLSTIREADEIHVIDEGRIVESGTHEQLVVLGGHYAEMVKLQSLSSYSNQLV